MSQIKVTNINNASAASGGIAFDADGHVTVDGLQLPSAGALSNRNLIINGAMQVWQRGTSFTPNSVIFGADRFAGYKASASAGDYARSTDVPSGEGFTYSAYFNGADIRQSIELPGAGIRGVFVDGSTWTVSFWVKSTTSGTSSVDVAWANGVSASSYTSWSSSQSYSYSTSWQRVSKTFTVSGAPTGSDYAVLVYINAAADQYITGVQFERGSTATPFEHRSYGDELARCQRYFQVIAQGAMMAATTNGTTQIANIGIFLATSMRATPTTNSVQFNAWFSSSGGVNTTTTMTITAADPSYAAYNGNVSGFTGLTDNRTAVINAGTALQLSAEL